ncbi:MAG: hypothetical protein ABFD66_06960, partial [Smithella sp.]
MIFTKTPDAQKKAASASGTCSFLPAPGLDSSKRSSSSGTYNTEQAFKSPADAKSPAIHYDFNNIPLYANGTGRGSIIGGESTAETGKSPNTASPREDENPDTVGSTEATETLPQEETTAAAREEEPSQPGIIEPVRIVRDVDLWWFDGENAANYDEEAKLTAFGPTRGATRGIFEWDVVRGTDKIDLE